MYNLFHLKVIIRTTQIVTWKYLKPLFKVGMYPYQKPLHMRLLTNCRKN